MQTPIFSAQPRNLSNGTGTEPWWSRKNASRLFPPRKTSQGSIWLCVCSLRWKLCLPASRNRIVAWWLSRAPEQLGDVLARFVGNGEGARIALAKGWFRCRIAKVIEPPLTRGSMAQKASGASPTRRFRHYRMYLQLSLRRALRYGSGRTDLSTSDGQTQYQAAVGRSPARRSPVRPNGGASPTRCSHGRAGSYQLPRFAFQHRVRRPRPVVRAARSTKRVLRLERFPAQYLQVEAVLA